MAKLMIEAGQGNVDAKKGFGKMMLFGATRTSGTADLGVRHFFEQLFSSRSTS